MSKIIPGLLYSESHEWVKVDGGVAIIEGTSLYKSSRELSDILSNISFISFSV